MIGGGNNLGSTPTEFFATFRPVAVVVAHHKVAYPPGLCRTRANVESLTRVGASNLYSLGEGQRAGPTVRKNLESNRVLKALNNEAPESKMGTDERTKLD